MQLAHWISTTQLNWPVPAWMGSWFSVIPTVETLVAQLAAAVLVIGSYFLARYIQVKRPRHPEETPAHSPQVPSVSLTGART